jgi:drug/metabolite transporter (DMT)-like permease
MTALTLAAGLLMGRDRLRVRARGGDWLKIAFLGVADALNVILFFAAYQRTSVAIAVLTHYLTPVLVALAAPVVLREPWNVRTLGAVLISMLGLVLLLAPWSAERHDADLLGAALGAASAVFYASNVVVSKGLVPVFSGSEMAFFHGLLAVPLLAFLVPHDAWSHVELIGASWLLLGALLAGATCGLLFVWGLRRVHASNASNLTLLEPLVATVGAAVAFREPLAPASMAGGALILTGAAVAIMTR